MNISEQPITIFWFRRDLRWIDNHGFYEALMRDEPVLPVFVFDKHILDELPEQDNRLIFIHRHLDAVRALENASIHIKWLILTPAK